MIGIAAVCGAASIFAADLWIKSQASAQVDQVKLSAVPDEAKVAFKTIVVATEPLRFGMKLERSKLSELPWPKDALPQGAFATIDAVLAEGNRVVLSPVAPNEPVLLAKLSGPNGRASLSNLLTPGMRAVTIETDEIAGVAGFVTPGDRVDVVLARNAGAIQEVSSNAKGAAGSTMTTEIVVENVKVLSVGQGADISQTAPQVANSVTIEVDADGARKVALARNVGSLSLSLRSAGDGLAQTGGLMTISAFGGSVTAGAADLGKSVIETVAKDDDRPKFTTVIVTRGTEPKSYQVLTPGEQALTPED